MGADGVFFHTYYPMPNRHPYDDEATGRLRFMGYPDLLLHKDKKYRVGIPDNPGAAVRLGLENQLPATLSPGEPGKEIRLDVADNVAEKAIEGELWKCELRVFLQHLMHYDEIRLVWNGREVPSEELRWADWTYQLRPHPEHAVNGYRLHIDLKNDLLPSVGTNTVRVDVLKKDPVLIHPVSVMEVELIVRYLPHRNALRPEEKYVD